MIEPIAEHPEGVERIITHMREAILNRLPWIDEAFGRAHRVYDTHSVGGRINYPAAYIGDGEYFSLLPNDDIGNFSWFEVSDPVTCLLSFLTNNNSEMN